MIIDQWIIIKSYIYYHCYHDFDVDRLSIMLACIHVNWKELNSSNSFHANLIVS